MAKEGLPFIFFAAGASVIFALLEWEIAAVAALAVTAFVLYFFRDPERVVPDGQGLLVSPADGKVIEIEQASEGAISRQAVTRVSIFMNVFNVHVNRFPVTGTVKRIEYQPGSFLPADQKKALIRNEQNKLLIADEAGNEITVVQVAGLIARRIVCWAETGDELKKGQRFGLIRFGSRLDIYLPPQYSVCVRQGRKVWAGQTIIAQLKK